MRKIVNPWIGVEGYHCFGCDPQHNSGLRMEFYEEGDYVVSRWEPTSEFQSWINTLHGGVQATILDELCGWVISRKLQRSGVTSRMDMRYRKPVHICNGAIYLRAKMVEQRRNIVTVEGAIYNSQGELCTQATCIYFLVTNENVPHRDYLLEEKELPLFEVLQNIE